MKVAVTGASGFIGKHVLRALQKQKLKVVAITRHAEKLSSFASSSCSIVEMDIANFDPRCFNKLGCPEVLIHLAWDGLPNYKSLHHFEVELPKQYVFLKSLIDDGLSKLIVAGTCFEYGMQFGGLSVNHSTQPTNSYGYAKTALHQQLKFLQQSMTFQLSWARFFYLYGEGQASSSLYSQLNVAIQRGDKIFNMSGGEQLRDFLSVETAAEQLVQLALTKHNGTINICSGKPISVRGLVEKWLDNTNIELNLGYYPYPDYEPMAFWGEK